MAEFVQVPIEKVPEESLLALLEEFATRDGTDYGAAETLVSTRVEQLRGQLRSGKAQLLFDVSSESWDIVASDEVPKLVQVASQATSEATSEATEQSNEWHDG